MDFVAEILNPLTIWAVIAYLILGLVVFLILYFKTTNEKTEFLLIKAFVLLFGVIYIFYALTCHLELDEFEHMYSSWMVSKGRIPYVDFFQHHHGLIWYIFAPVFYLAGETTASVLIVRGLNLITVFGILYLVYSIALEISHAKKTALYTLALAFSVNVFVRNAAAVRPDVLMTFFIFLSFLFFVKFYLRRRNIFLIFSGISLAFSFFALQKAVFYILPFLLATCFFWITKKIQFKQLVILGFSALIPVLLLLLVIWAAGFWNEYLFFNWIYNFEIPVNEAVKFIFKKPIQYLVTLNFIVVLFFSIIFFVQNIYKIPVLINVCFFIGIAGIFIIAFTGKSIFIHYFIWIVPFIIIHGAYLVGQLFTRFKIQLKLRFLFLYFMFAITIPVLTKKIHEKTLVQQMQLNQKIVNDLKQKNEKVLTCFAQLLYVENAHYLFFQTGAKTYGTTVLNYLVNSKKYQNLVTPQITEHANYNARQIIENEKPLYVFANPAFIESWDLHDILAKEYTFTKIGFWYKRNNEQ